ncbi:hypothetical protein N7541_003499 [Penicillium brevicompactum]|uniref:Uncharacterized protein n=1 Tax=Penicillium brevicompactum TaxID=5074 RepID=A0A9W9RNA7_PENBR|nr:hypothetical protein N7541_003499 [Penicillium brevicompactum]
MEDSFKSESHSTPISAQWESLKTMLPEPESTMSANDDLEAEILKAQAQLTQLKKQRELIDIQQKVAEERRELQLARDRLLATTNGLIEAAPAASSPATDAKARIEGPQKKQRVAHDPPTGPSGQNPPLRPSDPQNPYSAPPKPAQQQQKAQQKQPKNQGKPVQPKPAQAKQQPKAQPKAAPANPPAPKPSPNAGLSLEQLRQLAAASRTPSKAPQAPTGPAASGGNQIQTPVKPFNPPTQPSSESRAANPPPVPNIVVYNGRTLGEFKNYTVGMESHFKKHPEWYRSEEHKLSRALKHVSLSLEERFLNYIRNQPASAKTWETFCAFMIEQLQGGIRPDIAKARYNDSYQRPSQSVTDFSKWMMQWPPHFNSNDSERDRMRHLFEHLMNRVRNAAEKSHLDFDNYADFVNYLQWVEDSLDSRVDEFGRRARDGPAFSRKRARD